MGISKSIRRLTAYEADRLRERSRRRDAAKQQHRHAKVQRAEFHRDVAQGVEGAFVVALLLAFFAMIYWLAISDMVPAAY